eukprot:NODE_30_length_32972_cov_0.541052.p5 type:complete len:510 gc:universal NODE_30_length_32972_cov_0.541052:14693-13164(-)
MGPYFSFSELIEHSNKPDDPAISQEFVNGLLVTLVYCNAKNFVLVKDMIQSNLMSLNPEVLLTVLHQCEKHYLYRNDSILFLLDNDLEIEIVRSFGVVNSIQFKFRLSPVRIVSNVEEWARIIRGHLELRKIRHLYCYKLSSDYAFLTPGPSFANIMEFDFNRIYEDFQDENESSLISSFGSLISKGSSDRLSFNFLVGYSTSKVAIYNAERSKSLTVSGSQNRRLVTFGQLYIELKEKIMINGIISTKKLQDFIKKYGEFVLVEGYLGRISTGSSSIDVSSKANARDWALKADVGADAIFFKTSVGFDIGHTSSNFDSSSSSSTISGSLLPYDAKVIHILDLILNLIPESDIPPNLEKNTGIGMYGVKQEINLHVPDSKKDEICVKGWKYWVSDFYQLKRENGKSSYMLSSNNELSDFAYLFRKEGNKFIEAMKIVPDSSFNFYSDEKYYIGFKFSDSSFKVKTLKKDNLPNVEVEFLKNIEIQTKWLFRARTPNQVKECNFVIYQLI